MNTLLFKTYILLMLLLLFSCNLIGQEAKRPANKSGVCLSLTPHLAVAATFRLDVDKQVLDSKNWLIGSFTYAHRGESDGMTFDYDKVRVYGFTASYRYYLLKVDKPRLLYLQGGLAIEYAELSKYGYGWKETTYLESSALHYVEGTHYDKVLRTGADLKLGCVVNSNRFLFFDFYVGVGYREVQNIENHTGMRLNSDFFEPKYEGFVPLAGIRVGVNF